MKKQNNEQKYALMNAVGNISDTFLKNSADPKLAERVTAEKTSPSPVLRRVTVVLVAAILLAAMAAASVVISRPAGTDIEGTPNGQSGSEPNTAGSPDLPTDDSVVHPDGYFKPGYDENHPEAGWYCFTSTEHTDEFLKLLKENGYYTTAVNEAGEPVRSINKTYNTDNIEKIYNITPQSIKDVRPDVELFYDQNTEFLKIGNEIYRFGTFGGYYHQMYMWDYDGNGVKDLVMRHSQGSGISSMRVSLFDLTKKVSRGICGTSMLSYESIDSFMNSLKTEFINGSVYINGNVLTYQNGNFHCDHVIPPFTVIHLNPSDISGITVSSVPEGMNYSFTNEADVALIAAYFNGLNLSTEYEESPDEYFGMTWIVTVNYTSGQKYTYYHFGNMFLKSQDSGWYKMTYEEASGFDKLLEELTK